MSSTFTFDKLKQLNAMLGGLSPDPSFGPTYAGNRLIEALERKAAPSYGNPLSYAGIQVHKNPAFPMEIVCHKCSGTGEGNESTYCEKCSGQGKSRVEGVMAGGNGTMTMITSPLPLAFAPHWPKSVTVPLRSLAVRL